MDEGLNLPNPMGDFDRPIEPGYRYEDGRWVTGPELPKPKPKKRHPYIFVTYMAVLVVVAFAVLLFVREGGSGSGLPASRVTASPSRTTDIAASEQLMHDEAQAAAETFAAGGTPPQPVASPGCSIVAGVSGEFDTRADVRRAQSTFERQHPDFVMGHGIAKMSDGQWLGTTLVEAC